MQIDVSRDIIDPIHVFIQAAWQPLAPRYGVYVCGSPHTNDYIQQMAGQ